MPLAASPFSSVPQGISQPAMPPPGPGGAMAPPGGAQQPPGGAPGGPQEEMGKDGLDLFSRVAMLMIHDPRWIQIMAGLGMGRALEKVGKFASPPHRSNEELSAEGIPTGNPGQTGMP